MTAWWSPDRIIVKGDRGKRFEVRVVRRHTRRLRRIVARMSAAGRPTCWIATALGIAPETVAAWLASPIITHFGGRK